MQIKISKSENFHNKCLLLVGGDGDNIDVFSRLANDLDKALSNYRICSFDFSTETIGDERLLDIQAKELELLCHQLFDNHHVTNITIWCTSRGAYATSKLLASGKFNDKISHVIMYDPSNYYTGISNNGTWSGYQDYLPKSQVVSDVLTNIKGNTIIDVVHLTLRNYGPKGYFESEYINRGNDNPLGFPRLNTLMVKSFYSKLPQKNKGVYLEINTIPHGFVRDGDLQKNYERVVKSIKKLIIK